MSVAVVDRDPAWAKFLVPALACTGFTVQTLKCGADLLGRLHKTRLRLVVLDTSIDDYPPAVMLPALRDLHPNLRLILTSPYMTDSLREIIREAPPFCVVLKPVSRVSFLATVADALGLPALVW